MLLGDHLVNLPEFGHVVDDVLDERLVQGNHVFQERHGAEQDSVVFLIETVENFCQELGDVFRALLDDSDGSEDSFLSDVGAVVGYAFEDFVVKLSCEFSGTDFADNAENQANDAVVGAGQVDSQSVGGHHEEF